MCEIIIRVLVAFMKATVACANGACVKCHGRLPNNCAAACAYIFCYFFSVVSLLAFLSGTNSFPLANSLLGTCELIDFKYQVIASIL